MAASAGPLEAIDKDQIRAHHRSARLAARQPGDHTSVAFRASAAAIVALADSGVAAFQPTNGEPDIAAMVRSVAESAAVLLPRVAGGRELAWVRLQSADLTGRRTGIPRPAGAPVGIGWPALADAGVGLILVPALAIDPDTGHRVGYGAGYYDTLLAAAPDDLVPVGVCFERELRAVPAEPHDRPVRYILTESGLRRVGSPSGRAQRS